MTAYTITIDKEQAQALARATEILAQCLPPKEKQPAMPQDEDQAKANAEMAQVCLDMHKALGIQYGDNPYQRILALMGTERATECPHCGSVIEPANYNRPTGCVCNVREWADPENIPTVCDGFVGENHDINCGRCEHDYECHGINKQEGLP